MFSHAQIYRSAWQRLLCGLLCVCSWRGPVPVAHHHDQLSSRQDMQRSHVAVFHAAAAAPGEAQAVQADLNEWHWHFVLPDSLPTDKPGTPAERAVPELLSLACCVALHGDLLTSDSVPHCWSLAAWSLAGADFRQELLTTLPLLQSHRQRPVSFLASLQASAPTCALTGVAII